MQEYVCADGRMSVNGICSVPNQGDGKGNKDFSKDVKKSFEWDFDKVGNKIENFGDTIKGNINAYDNFLENNLGIPKDFTHGARAVGVGAGVAAHGIFGAALPFLIPFIGGGALNAKQKKANERITRITQQDTQGSNNTIDMMTYDIPTYGNEGFNIHNDAGDNNNSGRTETGFGGGYGRDPDDMA